MGLVGSIPSELSELRGLRGINLIGNNIMGVIPTEIGLLDLQSFDVHANTDLNALNDLSGQIPSELYSLTNLIHLDLGRSRLVGTIDKAIEKLTALKYLGLHHNLINGTLPIEIGKLENLGELVST